MVAGEVGGHEGNTLGRVLLKLCLGEKNTLGEQSKKLQPKGPRLARSSVNCARGARVQSLSRREQGTQGHILVLWRHPSRVHNKKKGVAGNDRVVLRERSELKGQDENGHQGEPYLPLAVGPITLILACAILGPSFYVLGN